ncbi:MAG TPA: segregation/condensation protein A [Malonomonas sp.]
MTIKIHLDNFDGPLDLLLHLINTNEMDIYDIPMVAITEQYLAIIEQMKQLDLDVAGEFLLMAATLIYIKSRTLLPVNEELLEEEEEDPRAELVRRLLEYQRYKQAAISLDQLPQLSRDLFVNQFLDTEILEGDADDEVVVGIYQLAEAFHRLLQSAPTEVFHEVIRESLSVAEYVQNLVERLADGQRRSFRELFPGPLRRDEVVVTFLAMLELVKMRRIKLEQAGEFSEIWLSLAGPVEPLSDVALGEATLGYG